jgi:hypothetical protein
MDASATDRDTVKQVITCYTKSEPEDPDSQADKP